MAVFVASVLTPIVLSVAAAPGATAVPDTTTARLERVPRTAVRVVERPARADVSRSRSQNGDRRATADVELPVPAAARAAAAAAAAPAPQPPAPEPSETTTAPTAMARVGEIALVVPCEPDVSAVVGFHQASGGALAMQPLGRLVDSAFAGWEPTDDGGKGHDHAVLASRGRGTEPTTAVDVALPAGSTVTAPTSGVVELVSDYALYGRHPDVTIRIVPDGVSDAVVQVFHVEDPVVAEGDRVEAGVTPLATVRQLPVKSQIDRITGDTRPHAHVEVRRT